jgi:hypothetical protein
MRQAISVQTEEKQKNKFWPFLLNELKPKG